MLELVENNPLPTDRLFFRNDSLAVFAHDSAGTRRKLDRGGLAWYEPARLWSFRGAAEWSRCSAPQRSSICSGRDTSGVWTPDENTPLGEKRCRAMCVVCCSISPFDEEPQSTRGGSIEDVLAGVSKYGQMFFETRVNEVDCWRLLIPKNMANRMAQLWPQRGAFLSHLGC